MDFSIGPSDDMMMCACLVQHRSAHLLPKYLFKMDYLESHELIEVVLPDDAGAWHEACGSAGDLFSEVVRGRFCQGEEWNLEVLTEAKIPLFRISVTSQGLLKSDALLPTVTKSLGAISTNALPR